MPLGKSLGNILGDYFGEEAIQLNQEPAQPTKQSVANYIPISKVEYSPYQTRTNFDFEKIQSLAQNIKENGLIHPIVVVEDDGKYILLAGERRLRASKLLEYTEILAIIRPKDSLNERQKAMLSAMENLQREDLSPIELAQTFQMLIKTQDISEQKLSEILSSSVQYIKNYLRLLTLSLPVQKALLERRIGEGQARHLVGLPEKIQQQLLDIIITRNLTVKEIIQYLEKGIQEKPQTKISSKFHNLSKEVLSKANKLAENFPGSKLKCTGDENKGKITITWDSTSKK